jgi:aspartate aminotransferase
MSKKENKNYTPNVNLNLNVRGKQQSATLEINRRIRDLHSQGKQVYRFGLGQSPFPVPQPVVDELKANAYQKDYLPVNGLLELREAVSMFHLRKEGIEFSAEDVLIAPGSKELMFILQLVYYGEIIIPAPAWVSYAPQAEIVGRQIHWIHTLEANDWKLAPQALDEICIKDPEKPRLLILNYPSNPTGSTYNNEELRAIARIARKYRIIVLSDEIYGELHYKGKHVSIARYYPEGTIISTGLSKWCGAGGWRLGTFTFPKGLYWLREAMAVVASETYTSTSAPIQYAAIRAYKGGIEIERYLWHSRRILELLATYLTTTFRDMGLAVCDPHGAFYVFVGFKAYTEKLSEKGITNSRDMCRSLLNDIGVAVLPGSVFGRDPAELNMRLSFVDFDGAKALADAEHSPIDEKLNNEFLLAHFGHIIEAVDKIKSWLEL